MSSREAGSATQETKTATHVAIVEADDVPPALAATERGHGVLDETEIDGQETITETMDVIVGKTLVGIENEETEIETTDQGMGHATAMMRKVVVNHPSTMIHVVQISQRNQHRRMSFQMIQASLFYSTTRPNLDPDAPDDVQDEGDEAIDDPDENAMMAMMGLGGFGSTKGKHVDGNQEGTANVKKTRTWRQYMNRRGGFNRPLDKIK
ncbi:DUF1777-domain-containing protein [Armillaria solidipes]|uniref:DUF1777-domain-containing protein n=1 Tax=Armillaria solidipes TaxID=1076256 RepID=A0A2H3C4M3_9AGAR|nr:DUF1777-domain-containing protein [Armillaria solidipes]